MTGAIFNMLRRYGQARANIPRLLRANRNTRLEEGGGSGGSKGTSTSAKAESAPGYYDIPGARMLPGGRLAASPNAAGQARTFSGIDIPTAPDQLPAEPIIPVAPAPTGEPTVLTNADVNFPLERIANQGGRDITDFADSGAARLLASGLFGPTTGEIGPGAGPTVYPTDWAADPGGPIQQGRIPGVIADRADLTLGFIGAEPLPATANQLNPLGSYGVGGEGGSFYGGRGSLNLPGGGSFAGDSPGGSLGNTIGGIIGMKTRAFREAVARGLIPPDWTPAGSTAGGYTGRTIAGIT